MKNYLLGLLLTLFAVSCNESEIIKKLPSELVKVTAVASQYFTIHSNQDTLVIGNDGTGIAYTANSFVFEDETPFEGIAQLELVELSETKDVIF